jgi:hypothetical protein
MKALSPQLEVQVASQSFQQNLGIQDPKSLY